MGRQGQRRVVLGARKGSRPDGGVNGGGKRRPASSRAPQLLATAPAHPRPPAHSS